MGRVLGPRLRTCPYRLSAQLAAALPILVGVCLLNATAALQSLLIGGAAVVGVFISGHGSRSRALLFCSSTAWLGALVGVKLV